MSPELLEFSKMLFLVCGFLLIIAFVFLIMIFLLAFVLEIIINVFE